MAMQATQPFGIRRHTGTSRDRNGNPIETWSAPEAHKAFSIGPRYATEQDGRLTITGLVLGIPEDFGIRPKDRIVIDQQEWTVDGALVNANRGPFSYRPGWVLNVRRAA